MREYTPHDLSMRDKRRYLSPQRFERRYAECCSIRSIIYRAAIDIAIIFWSPLPHSDATRVTGHASSTGRAAGADYRRERHSYRPCAMLREFPRAED